MVVPRIRMQRLVGRLAMVRGGKGAAVIPPGVKRLLLNYPLKNADGNIGPRKFTQTYMPSLKYHNPDIQMDVIRTTNVGGAATLTIEFDSGDPKIIDMKYRDKAEIFDAVLDATKATPIPMSEEDNAMILEYEAFKKREAQRQANTIARRAAAKVAGRQMNISPLIQ